MGNVWKIVDIHPFLSTIDRRQERLLMNLSNMRAMQSSHDDVIVMSLTCCKLSDTFEMDGGESLEPKMAEEGIKMASKKIEEVKKNRTEKFQNSKSKIGNFFKSCKSLVKHLFYFLQV